MGFLIGVVIFSLGASYWVLWHFWEAPEWPEGSFVLPVFQAHRGYWVDGEKQNSLGAISKAYRKGYEIVEFDVRETQDGIPILFHDPVFYFEGNKFIVAELTASEIKKMIDVPTLEEVLKLREIPKFLNIELKSESLRVRKLVESVHKLLVQNQFESRVVVSSFNPFTLYKLKSLNSKIPVALIHTEEKLMGYYFWLRKMWMTPLLRPHVLHLDHRDLNENRIRSYLERRIPIVAWTVNDDQRAKQLLTLGVRGIISDELPYLDL